MNRLSVDSVLKKIFYFYADKTGLYHNDFNLASSHYTNWITDGSEVSSALPAVS